MSTQLTLTALTENIFRARDKVARELVGFIPSVITNTDSNRVSTGGTVDSIKTGEPTLSESVTPAMTIPEGDAQTLTVEQLSLDKAVSVKIPIQGENARKLENVDSYQTAVDDMFAQAIRKAVNKIELVGGNALSLAASRAVGTAGTTPFASNFNLIADARQVLADNGAPMQDMDRSLIVNTSAGTNLRQISGLWQANTAGTDATLRQGELLNIHGFAMKESAQVDLHTKGTGTGDTLVGTPAIGTTVLTSSAFTAGEFVAGDVIIIQDDPNQYVITSADASVNQITIAEPGLKVTGIAGKTITIAIQATHTGNIGLHRSAAELAMRPPALPMGGDAAIDRMIIADDRSPLVFEVAHYVGYRKAMFAIEAVYGWKAWNPEFIVKLLG